MGHERQHKWGLSRFSNRFTSVLPLAKNDMRFHARLAWLPSNWTSLGQNFDFIPIGSSAPACCSLDNEDMTILDLQSIYSQYKPPDCLTSSGTCDAEWGIGHAVCTLEEKWCGPSTAHSIPRLVASTIPIALQFFLDLNCASTGRQLSPTCLCGHDINSTLYDLW